jgi:hypothetical protein
MYPIIVSVILLFPQGRRIKIGPILARLMHFMGRSFSQLLNFLGTCVRNICLRIGFLKCLNIKHLRKKCISRAYADLLISSRGRGYELHRPYCPLVPSWIYSTTS